MGDFRLAAKSFIVNDGKLLVIKRAADDVQKPNIWEIPGGRLELGEDPVEGLKREVLEETGINIEVQNPLSVRHFTRADNQKITMLVFLCRALNEDVKLSKEHAAFDWIDIDNCKEKLAEFFHKEVDEFKRLKLFK